jgi:hypothetical protein
MPNNYKQNNPLYYNAFINGLYDLDSAMIHFKEDECSAHNKKKSTGKITKMHLEQIEELSPYDIINSAIFANYDICPNCYKLSKKGKVFLDEILSGFKRDKSTYFSTCYMCQIRFFPKYVVFTY